MGASSSIAGKSVERDRVSDSDEEESLDQSTSSEGSIRSPGDMQPSATQEGNVGMSTSDSIFEFWKNDSTDDQLSLEPSTEKVVSDFDAAAETFGTSMITAFLVAVILFPKSGVTPTEAKAITEKLSRRIDRDVSSMRVEEFDFETLVSHVGKISPVQMLFRWREGNICVSHECVSRTALEKGDRTVSLCRRYIRDGMEIAVEFFASDFCRKISSDSISSRRRRVTEGIRFLTELNKISPADPSLAHSDLWRETKKRFTAQLANFLCDDEVLEIFWRENTNKHHLLNLWDMAGDGENPGIENSGSRLASWVQTSTKIQTFESVFEILNVSNLESHAFSVAIAADDFSRRYPNDAPRLLDLNLLLLRSYSQNKKFEFAITAANRILQLSAVSPEVTIENLRTRGRAAAALGQKEVSISDFNRARDFISENFGDESPHIFQIFLEIGKVHGKFGDHVSAVGNFEKALGGPEEISFSAHANMSRLLFNLGDISPSVQHASLALELFSKIKNPDETQLSEFAVARACLGGAKLLCTDENLEEILDHFSCALAELRKDESGEFAEIVADICFKSSSLLSGMGKIDEAIENLKISIQLTRENLAGISSDGTVAGNFPELSVLEENLKILEGVKEMQDMALTTAQTVGSKISSELVDSLIDAGNFLRTQSSAEAALAKFESALRLVSGDIRHSLLAARCLYFIGLANSDLGRYEISAENFFQCLHIFRQLNAENNLTVDSDEICTCICDLGKTLMEIERFSEALKELESALKISSENFLPMILNLIGSVHARLGEHELALEFFENSLQRTQPLLATASPAFIFRTFVSQEATGEISQMRDSASSLMNIGDVYLREGRLDEALKSFQEALAVLRDLPADTLTGNCMLITGVIFQRQGLLFESQLHLEQALSAFKSLNDFQGVGECQLNLGVTLIKKARYQEAISMLELALEAKQQVSEGPLRAVGDEDACLCNIAHAYRLQAEGRQLDHEVNFSRPLIAIGTDLLLSGNYLESIGHLRAAMSLSFCDPLSKPSYIISKLGQCRKGEYADGLMRQGARSLELARLQDSLAQYQTALAIRLELVGTQDEPALWSGIVNLHLCIGNVHSRKKDFDSALQSFESALTVLSNHRQGDSQDELARVLVNMGVITSVKGDSEKSLEYYLRAMDVYRETATDTPDVANLWNLIGLTQTSLRDFQSAITSFETCIGIRVRLRVQPKEVGVTFFNLGRAHVAAGNREKAAEAFESAMLAFEELFGTDDELFLEARANLFNCK